MSISMSMSAIAASPVAIRSFEGMRASPVQKAAAPKAVSFKTKATRESLSVQAIAEPPKKETKEAATNVRPKVRPAQTGGRGTPLCAPDAHEITCGGGREIAPSESPPARSV